MRRADAELLDRLSTGPSFLLLGQDWSTIAGNQADPVASALVGVADGGSGRPYDRVIGLPPEHPDDDLPDEPSDAA